MTYKRIERVWPDTYGIFRQDHLSKSQWNVANKVIKFIIRHKVRINGRKQLLKIKNYSVFGLDSSELITKLETLANNKDGEEKTAIEREIKLIKRKIDKYIKIIFEIDSEIKTLVFNVIPIAPEGELSLSKSTYWTGVIDVPIPQPFVYGFVADIKNLDDIRVDRGFSPTIVTLPDHLEWVNENLVPTDALIRSIDIIRTSEVTKTQMHGLLRYNADRVKDPKNVDFIDHLNRDKKLLIALIKIQLLMGKRTGVFRGWKGISTLDIAIVCLPLGKMSLLQVLDHQFSPSKSMEIFYGLIRAIKRAADLPPKEF